MKGLKGREEDLELYPTGSKAPMEGFHSDSGQPGLCFGRSSPAEYSKGGVPGTKVGRPGGGCRSHPEEQGQWPDSSSGSEMGEKGPTQRGDRLDVGHKGQQGGQVQMPSTRTEIFRENVEGPSVGHD